MERLQGSALPTPPVHRPELATSAVINEALAGESDADDADDYGSDAANAQLTRRSKRLRPARKNNGNGIPGDDDDVVDDDADEEGDGFDPFEDDGADPFASDVENASDEETLLAKVGRRKRKTDRTVKAESWVLVAGGLDHDQLQQHLHALARDEMSGGKWVGSDSDKGFKPRSEKVGEHREVASFAKVVRCCFNKESDCPARLRIIRHAEAAAEGRAGRSSSSKRGRR
jgi:hypothetical protein